MSDSILFLALATIFGAAMLLVGWTLHGIREERDVQKSISQWTRDFDPVDRAGA